MNRDMVARAGLKLLNEVCLEELTCDFSGPWQDNSWKGWWGANPPSDRTKHIATKEV